MANDINYLVYRIPLQTSHFLSNIYRMKHHSKTEIIATYLLITCDLLGTRVVAAAHILAHLFKISRIHTADDLRSVFVFLMFSCNLRVTVEPYMYQIFKIHSSKTQID